MPELRACPRLRVGTANSILKWTGLGQLVKHPYSTRCQGFERNLRFTVNAKIK
jgi:hypothetical protein